MNKDLKKSRIQAEESDQLKSQFLKNISHEIRTPLNGILGFSDMIVNEELSKKELAQAHYYIIKNSGDLTDTIENIVDIAHLTTNQYNVNKTNFDLQYEINEVITKIKYSAIYSKKSDINSLQINYDRQIIKKIIYQLTQNAIRYTEQGEIRIGFQEKKSSIELYVKDTGIGISQESINTIFAPFKKGKERISEITRGNGLGLAIVYNLVMLLNGDIRVESEPKKGSTFFISLPF